MTTSLSSQISGLSNFIYAPEYGTFDNIDEKGDVSIQVATGALNNINFPSLRASYGVYKNFIIGANFFSFGSRDPVLNGQRTEAFIFSGDVGIFKKIDFGGERKVKLHSTLSYGQGKVNRTFTNFAGNVRLGIQRYSLIGGGIMHLNKKISIGLGLTGKLFNYSNRGAVGEVSGEELDDFGRIIELSPSFLIDLNTRLEFGDEIGKLFFNWDFALRNFQDDSISGFLAQDVIHIGFNVIINEAINKIKIKRNEKFK